MKLTPGRLFTLKHLSREVATANDISRAAVGARMNLRWSGIHEWADAHILALRQAGLVEFTGGLEGGRRVYRITEAGQEALKEAENG